MSRTIISTDKAPAPVGAYSQAVKAGSFLFVSGQIALDPKTGKLVNRDLAAETKQVLENLKAVVEAGDCSFPEDLVKVNIYLSDISFFGTVNEVYGQYFSERPPARACIQAAGLPKNVRVEIECTAYLQSRGS